MAVGIPPVVQFLNRKGNFHGSSPRKKTIVHFIGHCPPGPQILGRSGFWSSLSSTQPPQMCAVPQLMPFNPRNPKKQEKKPNRRIKNKLPKFHGRSKIKINARGVQKWTREIRQGQKYSPGVLANVVEGQPPGHKV